MVGGRTGTQQHAATRQRRSGPQQYIAAARHVAAKALHHRHRHPRSYKPRTLRLADVVRPGLELLQIPLLLGGELLPPAIQAQQVGVLVGVPIAGQDCLLRTRTVESHATRQITREETRGTKNNDGLLQAAPHTERVGTTQGPPEKNQTSVWWGDGNTAAHFA